MTEFQKNGEELVMLEGNSLTFVYADCSATYFFEGIEQVGEVSFDCGTTITYRFYNAAGKKPEESRGSETTGNVTDSRS